MTLDDRMNDLARSQIEHNIRWMQAHLTGLAAGVTNLPHRPPFTSTIEAELEALEDKLTGMLERVHEVQARYREKPVFIRAPDVDLREDCRMLSLEAAE